MGKLADSDGDTLDDPTTELEYDNHEACDNAGCPHRTRDLEETTTMTEVTKRLQSWYAAMCDGSWEHQHGVRIDTIDNPGWLVRIDINGTGVKGKSFEAISIHRTDADWIRCEIKGDTYEGVGGASNLTELLDVFLQWAEK